MKFIIVSFLMMFSITFQTSNAHAQLTPILHNCDTLDPSLFSYKNTASMDCADSKPITALQNIFVNNNILKLKKAKKNHEDASLKLKAYIVNFERVDPTPGGEGYTLLATDNHAYYLKTTKDNKVIELQQGYEKNGKSPFCYKYKIKEYKDLKFCEADKPEGYECTQKWISDPIRNPTNKREKSCNVFLAAMLSCSSSEKAAEGCSEDIYNRLNADDARTQKIVKPAVKSKESQGNK